MSSTVYLITRKLKNRIKEALHSPAQLIIIIIFAALIIFTVYTGNMVPAAENLRSKDEFYAIVLALYAFIFFMTAKSGFVNGASMFTMADVNLIFTSPKKQNRVLTYGLLSQLGRSLLLGFFILYQYAWAHDSYGIDYGDLIAVLVGYGVTVFLSQMLAMLIYSVSSGSDKKNRAFKIIFYAIVAAFAVGLAVKAYLMQGSVLQNATELAGSAVMKFFPVAGFVQLGVVGFIGGKTSYIIISLACIAAFCALYFVIISVVNADYYEDVLKATEVSFSAITARKEGRVAENSPRNVKTGKTGFTHGDGASAIAAKHTIENRRGRFFAIDATGIVMAVITIGLGFFTKDLMLTLICNIYIMIFTAGTGRWAKELTLPYVYLIPEPPFKKLVFMLLEQLPSLAAEGIITFVPFCFILKLSVLETAALVFVKISFGILFIGVNLLLERLFGSSDKKVLIVMLYFLFAAIFAVPAIAAYCVFAFVIQASYAPAFFAMAAANLLTATVLIFACRNILECAEYNNK